MPSCVPAAQPIIALVYRWLAAGDDHLARALISRCEPGHAFCPFDFLRFEAVLEAVSRETPKFLRLLQALQTHGSPNLSHLFLIRAAAKGARVLTTNFDTRLEMAAEWSAIAAPMFILSPNRAITPTMAGWQMVPMIDRALALTLSESLGFDARVVALLLPAIGVGLWSAFGKDATPGVDDDERQGESGL